jgi:tetratricopeptide (TPR) repeat protein
LKIGTFENNCYILNGLDKESATDFAHEILESIDIPVKTIVKDGDFEHLMRLLAGYPLALKAILPNLKQKTAKRILEELNEGVGALDRGNIQHRTESIIKCIEYAHSNLSEEAQQLLLCLTPFQSVVNVNPAIINNYFEELKKEEHFQNYPFDQFETVIQEAVQNGFMQTVIPDDTVGLMTFQPVFTFFLKNKLNAEKAFLLQSLQNAYINYYRGLSKTLGQYLTSQKPEEQQIGLFYTGYEYENLYQVLIHSLKREESFLDVYKVIDKYLNKKQEQERLLQIGEMVHKKMQQYDPQRLTKEIGFEFSDSKFKLANYYYTNKKYSLARETYEQLIAWINTNPSFFEHPEFTKGEVYLNLGVVAKEQQDYAAAREYYQKALAIFVQYNDVYGQGEVYLDLGVVAKEQQDYAAAREYYQKALAIFVQYKDVHRQAQVYQNLGLVAAEQQYYAAAREYYQKALAIYVQYKDVHRQAQVYQNLGIVAREQQDYAAAREYYQKALAIFVQYEDVHKQGLVYGNLGVAAAEQQDYAAAREYYQKAVAIYVQYKDVYRQAQVYQNLGIVAREQQDYAAAREYYEKTFDIYLKFPEDVNSIRGIINIIYDFAKETNNKAFCQAMLQKAMLHFEGDNNAKTYLQKLLDDLNQL